MVYRHSGYPGGLKSRSFADAQARKPEEAVRRAIRGMLPKNRLGAQMLTKLKVYAAPNHPHSAQMPETPELAAAPRPASATPPCPTPSCIPPAAPRSPAPATETRLAP